MHFFPFHFSPSHSFWKHNQKKGARVLVFCIIKKPLSICVNIFSIICQFIHVFCYSFVNQKPMHNFQNITLSCLSIIVYCSTNLVTDHDNPVVKSNQPDLSLTKINSNTFHYCTSTHNNPEYSKVIQEKNVITHCSSPKYWIGTQKWRIAYLKSHVILKWTNL